MTPSSKSDAKRFLQRLERFLNARLPAPAVMRAEVDALVKEAKASTDQRHKAFPEGGRSQRLHFAIDRAVPS
jgi:hypothetical protein